jgi:hypothetical protein
MNKLSPCPDEFCWLETDILKKINSEDIHSNTFRPKMPKEWTSNMNAWLSTIDIEECMDQYEVLHKDFLFIGPVPIDFDSENGFGQCISNELCRINIASLMKKGIKKIGVIFNLDPHYKGGSHWVGCYIDLNKGGIFYYDSYGINPPNEIIVFMKRVRSQGNKLIDKNTPSLPRSKNYDEYDKLQHSAFRIYINKKRFQYKDSECGMYSMIFIILLLKGVKFSDYVSSPISDDKVMEMRLKLFRPYV